jgi:hypothetical protein
VVDGGAKVEGRKVLKPNGTVGMEVDKLVGGEGERGANELERVEKGERLAGR